MKMLYRIALSALFLGMAAPIQAEQKVEDKETVTSSISESSSDNSTTSSDQDTGFEQAIAALVSGSLAGDDGEEDTDSDDLSIRAFYTGSEAGPIWVDENGETKRALDAAVEIAQAGKYGLDPGDYKLPELDSIKTRDALAKYELAMTRTVLAYANHVKAGRIHPSKVRHSQNDPEGLKNVRGFLERLRSSGDTAAVLRDLHPKHPQYVALAKKLDELRGGNGDKPKVQIPDGPVLKPGVRHEHVTLLRKRLEIDGADGADAEKYDEAVEQAVKAFQKQKGLKQDGVVGNNTRHAMNGESNEQLIVRILTNMERWRWLPDDLGGDAGIYVWTNIPEYRVRIVKAGDVVFNERVIVGKTNKQTPVFSDEMEWIEIHPTWYVPMSIIVEDIGPSLKRPTSTVMERYHLQLNCGAHGRDWKKIDWNRVSIRNCSVSQPPGAKSVLGDFKFKFPNKHIVYMHDTPTKRLFNASTRTYSHGCVRVRNPRRMAEILLDHDKKMPASKLDAILKGPKRLHKEVLNRHVPVHMTYFTVFFNEKGEMQTFRDVYGHDRRLAQLLTGKGHLLPVPAVAVSRKKRAPRRTRTAQDRVWSNALSAN